ncbi:MAG: sialate O-acetylesterase [Phycisphaerae bacterium]|jgi:sialate O-acetylesterase|nr:sialate O-acetylesterase [Phycisphaerae bacterium]
MKNTSTAKVLLYLCAVAVLTVPAACHAATKVNPIFTDNMVLQRDMSVPVWGSADAGEEITVKFAGQTKTTKADKDGKWRVNLDAMKACAKAQTMTVGEVSFKEVLIGDVWVGSGQSNMAGGAGGYARRDEGLKKIIEAAPYPLLRLCRGSRPGWKQADAKSAQGFSALLLSFGVPLQKELDVPVGLIVGAVGGTPSGRWLSPEAFEADKACQAAAKAHNSKTDSEAALKKYEEALKKWKIAAAAAKAAKKRAPRRPRPPQLAKARGDLFIAHIRPVIPYAIRGVVWDQGESKTQVAGVDQFTIMGALIRGWRTEWKQDFPFIYVQKPSGGGCAWDKEDNPVTNQASSYSDKLPQSLRNDGAYRELHVRIMQHANTYMAISSDLGSGVHPTNKSGYGLRACRVALGAAYGRDVEYYGPLYDSHKIEGASIRISFKHVGKGLAFKGGKKLTGFQIAGDDGKFEWADAKIDGKTVVLTCDKVAKPTAARYAWARNRPWANLFNKDGLPAITFQTKK